MTPQEDADPFHSLLTLEDHLYTAAYTLGATDGAKAGKVQGRIFGLEKGFEKFAALGVLHGRSLVWGARLPKVRKEANQGKGGKTVTAKGGEMELSVGKNMAGESPGTEAQHRTTEQGNEAGDDLQRRLPHLPPLARLAPHVTLLHSLTDLATFATANTEDGVADLDDRFRRGQAKAKLVELLIKEPSSAGKLGVFKHVQGSSSKSAKVSGGGDGVKNGDNMEDFGGSRLLH